MADSWLPERLSAHLHALDHYWRGEPEIRLLRRICSSNRTAVDVGANIGTYTYFLRTITSRVYAYEPNPELAARLERIFPKVRVRNVALSDRTATVELHIPKTNGKLRHELGSIAQSFGQDVQVHQVDAVTLDSEVLPDVGFLKIDVEQHERAVLRGALETISTWRPVIMTEVTPLLYESRLDQTLAFLTNLDYVGWFGFGRAYVPLTEFDPQHHANPVNWGNPNAFIRNNMFFFPRENDLARVGPDRRGR
jgi:FkbM family methyltransferase